MSDDNIRDFHVPEKPRAKTNSLRAASIKAKKYDSLIQLIEADLEAMRERRKEFNDKSLPIGFHNGYQYGAAHTYDWIIKTLENYLEQSTYEGD